MPFSIIKINKTFLCHGTFNLGCVKKNCPLPNLNPGVPGAVLQTALSLLISLFCDIWLEYLKHFHVNIVWAIN